MFNHKLSILLILLVFIIGCGSKGGNGAGEGSSNQGYTIQAGAFKNVENAGRLVDTLNSRGLDAFLFKEGGSFKVRFGDFKSKDEARRKALSLQKSGKIEEFYIVAPEDFAVYKGKSKGSGYLRDELVRTAVRYIGVPYVWGGTSSSGFDCSGLTRSVYRLNGLSIPRVSRDQFNHGKYIKKSALQKGDLVFFGTSGGKKVNHVGIYIGGGKFIHAPSKGKTVRQDNLNSKYWTKVYLGGRCYI